MAPEPILDLLDYPEEDERTIMNAAREGNAALGAALGAGVGGAVAGPAGILVGASAGAVAGYEGLVDEETLYEVLTLIRRLSMGDWPKVEGLALDWQAEIGTPAAVADGLRGAAREVDRYWNGAAHDAFADYLATAITRIEAVSDKISELSDHLAELIKHVSNATGDLIREIGNCARAVLDNYIPLKWPGIIGGFLAAASNLLGEAVKRFGALRADAVKVCNAVAEMKEIEPPNVGLVSDGTKSRGGLSGWDVQRV